MAMRERGLEVMRNRSPPPKIRDQRPDWYPELDSRRHDDTRHPDTRSRRSLSPDRGNGRRIMGVKRRNPSLERREFKRILDDKRGVLRPHSPFDSKRPLGRDIDERPHFDEGFFMRDSPSRDFRCNYLLSEPSAVGPESKRVGRAAMASVKNRDKEFQGGPENGSALDGKAMLVQKSITLDGTIRPFFTLPPENFLPQGPNSSRIGGFPSSGNLGSNQDLRYRDVVNARANKLPMRDPYEGEEKRTYFRRDEHPYLPPQSKALGSTSSSLSKDHFYGSVREPPSSGYGRSSKFPDPLSCERRGSSDVFDDPNLMGSKDLRKYPKGPPLSPPPRDKALDYGFSELGRGERLGSGLSGGVFYGKIHASSRGDYGHREPFGQHFVNPISERLDDVGASRRSLRENALGDPPLPSDAMELIISGNTHHPDYGMQPSRDFSISLPRDDYSCRREPAPLSYREGLKSSSVSEIEKDVYRPGLSAQRKLHEEDLSMDVPRERLIKRKFVVDEMSGEPHLMRGEFSSERGIARRTHEFDVEDRDDKWIDRAQGGLSISKSLNIDHPQYRTSRSFNEVASNRVSGLWLPRENETEQAKGAVLDRLSYGRNFSFKRRSRLSPQDFDPSSRFNDSHDHKRLFKFRKSYQEDDRHEGGLSLQDEEQRDDDMTPQIKPEPPEHSEEFKQLVHRAFLRFSKELNENPGQRKRYKEQGKAGSVRCIVCDSLSKEFSDTHNLVMHTYNSQKVGLKTDHLGLHRAICVLMGWNSLVPPDTARAYQNLTNAEASAQKEDLIVWPPVVVIHNKSIVINKNAEGQVVVSVDRMEEILREMSFNTGKVKVWKGKHLSLSILLVKFPGTFSGLQDAERLHKHYFDKGRGRKEWQNHLKFKAEPSKTSDSSEKEDSSLLYGYIGLAGDIDKFDIGTKKRCVVKSMKDIKAIADAPLKTRE
ncbi:uncharacterized protein LOC18441382 [Amborella trichopoda]|uniref:XS domain-containing protein n=1 Tax=Amborella trichopoda TaxID=13333 RepID=W1PYJ4_AMBTC|nr:uncharacterized protein LOC18441382 [Amborella trichopoda]XP_020527294.1 uncharacterized protein LOC18441382 [Amborella trichopoda]ERN13144.1 hypothetical protein AMTR_s00040p00190140 [Amborella trichopoda]|eukprot:XP_006851563.1 uncharacterized protein LOC18441382 [Amborella trichopoda]